MKYCSSKSMKRAKIFNKGSERVSKQLDIVKFLRKQMLLDCLIKTQFSPQERLLASRQYKTFVLGASSTDESSGSDSDDFSALKSKRKSNDKPGHHDSLQTRSQVKNFENKYALALAKGIYRPNQLQELMTLSQNTSQSSSFLHSSIPIKTKGGQPAVRQMKQKEPALQFDPGQKQTPVPTLQQNYGSSPPFIVEQPKSHRVPNHSIWYDATLSMDNST